MPLINPQHIQSRQPGQSSMSYPDIYWIWKFICQVPALFITQYLMEETCKYFCCFCSPPPHQRFNLLRSELYSSCIIFLARLNECLRAWVSEGSAIMPAWTLSPVLDQAIWMFSAWSWLSEIDIRYSPSAFISLAWQRCHHANGWGGRRYRTWQFIFILCRIHKFQFHNLIAKGS